MINFIDCFNMAVDIYGYRNVKSTAIIHPNPINHLKPVKIKKYHLFRMKHSKSILSIFYILILISHFYLYIKPPAARKKRHATL
jgi:hypothetical protein